MPWPPCFAAGLAPAATAAAPTPTQDTRLQLTAERTVDGQDTVAFVWLDCPASDRPAHPHRAEACAALDTPGGDFDGLRGEPHGSCTAAPPSRIAHAATHASGALPSWLGNAHGLTDRDK
ncbi:SSI family serine proteinase inhibitor [Streptomyces sp. NPDC058548]|uniref:SSI family serine proteinase inhibitor n=1 Tax=Streptomyces sp. NPDC058548 TaxID=3346545 RepID=UPI003647D146